MCMYVSARSFCHYQRFSVMPFGRSCPHAGSDFRESLGYTADAGRTAAANTPYKRSESSKLKAL